MFEVRSFSEAEIRWPKGDGRKVEREVEEREEKKREMFL